MELVGRAGGWGKWVELVGGASGLVQYVNRRTTFLCKSGLDGACTHIHTYIHKSTRSCIL